MDGTLFSAIGGTSATGGWLPWHYVAVWLLVVNLAAAWLYWSDKRRARLGAWRVPEQTLLLCGFLGGWPAALVTSQMIRHKTSKGSFRAKFWATVVVQVVLLAGAWFWLHRTRDTIDIRVAPARLSRYDP